MAEQSSMAAQAQTVFADIAALRWPKATHIFGTGRFALLSRCPDLPFVQLYETGIEAQTVLHDRCRHAFCKGAHFLFDLAQRPVQNTPVSYKPKPHWVKLIGEDN